MPSMPAIALKATLATTLSEMVTPLAAAGASGLGVSVIAVLPSSVVDGRRVRRPGTSVRLLYPSRGAACQTPRRKRREECVLADGAAGSAAVAVGASGIVAHRAAALVPHVAAAVGASALRHLGERELRLRSAGRRRGGGRRIADAALVRPGGAGRLPLLRRRHAARGRLRGVQQSRMRLQQLRLSRLRRQSARAPLVAFAWAFDTPRPVTGTVGVQKSPAAARGGRGLLY